MQGKLKHARFPCTFTAGGLAIRERTSEIGGSVTEFERLEAQLGRGAVVSRKIDIHQLAVLFRDGAKLVLQVVHQAGGGFRGSVVGAAGILAGAGSQYRIAVYAI